MVDDYLHGHCRQRYVRIQLGMFHDSILNHNFGLAG